MFWPEPKGNEGEVSQSTFLLASGRTNERGEGSSLSELTWKQSHLPKRATAVMLTGSQAVTFDLFPGGDMEKVLVASSLDLH